MSRNFCITVYPREPENASDCVGDCLHPEEWDQNLVRYFVWQLEACPETGRPHYQCYLETHRAVRFSKIKKLPGLEDAHVEARKGTREEAKTYCQKEETRIDGPWEFGSWESGGQGRRTDIAEMVQDIKSGKSDLEILDKSPALYVRHYKAISHIRSLITPPRNFKTRVYFLYGNPGNGKSNLARELLPDAFWKQPSSIWWCGYHGEDVVIDDFKGWMPYSDLLRLLDCYPLQVQTKGGQVQMVAKHLVLTSSVIPTKWYDPEKVRFNWEEFARRVDVWIHFPEKFQPEEISQNEFEKIYLF
jgi:Putative viral replication protein./RNA helicase.